MAPLSVGSRLLFPTDGPIHNEELTLSKMSSRLSTVSALNDNPPVSSGQDVAELPPEINGSLPQRRHLVFTDPIAFRSVSGTPL
jgi:hypothetical protein